jgi:Helix-turn-helix of DDE superfamily endonuclease
MEYNKIKMLKAEKFRRLTGVKRGTFLKMLKVLEAAEAKKRWHGGRPPKMAVADRLLMTLTYLREYRTFFHISQSYDISESVCFRIIRWVENTLMQSGLFRLPGKKALLASDTIFDVVLVDATETPVERPKKSNDAATPARKSAIR